MVFGDQVYMTSMKAKCALFELSRFGPVKFRNVKLMGYHFAIKNVLDFLLAVLLKKIIGHYVIP